MYTAESTSISGCNSPLRGWHQIYVTRANNNPNEVQQIAIHTDGVIYRRTCNGGVWSSWIRLAFETDLPTANILGTDGFGIAGGDIGGLANGASMFVAEHNFNIGLYIINVWVNVLNCTTTDFPNLYVQLYADNNPLYGSAFVNGAGETYDAIVPIIGNSRNWNTPIFASSTVLYIDRDNLQVKLNVINNTGEAISNEYPTSFCGYKYFKIG